MRIIVIVLALLAAACKPLSAPLAGDPSDPSAPVPPVRYQSALGAYERQRPVAPSSWREQNERVTPQPGRSNP
jgi:hypothetical protein